MSRLTGKTVLVTGGGSGIGLATTRLLLDEGARVAITGRNEAKLQAAAATLQAGDRLLVHAADLTDASQVQRLVAAVGPVDILVNNAGMNLKQRKFSELTADTWNELLAGNLDSAFYCMHAVLPSMRQRGGGLIIVVNSISGVRANPLGGIGYIAAKFGLRGLAMGLAAEEKPNNIRVTSIYPGEVNTPILEMRPEPVSEERKANMLQPEDVARTILFVATLPAHVAIPELIITPANATYI
jgi:NADP-dependent 3-hydroxy acid dehydrogenase YdfG